MTTYFHELSTEHAAATRPQAGQCLPVFQEAIRMVELLAILGKRSLWALLDCSDLAIDHRLTEYLIMLDGPRETPVRI